MTDKMVERLARIMCVSETTDDPDDTALALGTGKKRWQAWEKPAATALALLSDCGYVIVPREPTEAMINAAPDLGAVDFYPSDVWRAMIAAALAEETT